MKKILPILFFVVTIFCYSNINAQRFTSSSALQNQKMLQDQVPPDELEIYDDYKKRHHLGSFVDFIPEIEDSIIEGRIANINSDIPLRYDKHIAAFIDYFSIRNREYTRKMMRRAEVYFPIVEEILKKNNMPQSLKYLAIVESGLDPTIKSWAGAVGLWQFMPATGKSYGMNYDYYMDEKQNPYKSTVAACKYLKDLYRTFNDWELALSAYNCGPGNIRKAIRQSGGKKTFSEIYNYLPKETRSYVPQFMAVNYVMRYAHTHNLYIEDWESDYLPEFDTVLVNKYVDLEKFCEVSGICTDEMLKLNPELKKNIVSENWKDYPLNIPKDLLVIGKDSIHSLLDIASVKKEVPVEEQETTTTYVTKKVNEKHYHYVKRGESLGGVASKYGVSVSDIKKWSGTKSNTIYPGQRLVIYKTVYKKVKTSTPGTEDKKTEEKEESDKTTAVSTKEHVKTEKSSSSNGTTYHVVKKGDYLGKIATIYGVSITDIKKWNGLKSNNVMLGQKLIVKKSKTDKTEAEDKVVQKSSEIKDDKTIKKTSLPAGEKVYYTVKSGDALGKIAEDNQISLSKIKEWNNLETNTVKPGQKLIIGFGSTSEKKEPKKESQTKNSTTYHTVVSGESLYSISKKYGLTVDELKSLNNIKGNTLSTGQKLKIAKEEKIEVSVDPKENKYQGKTYTVQPGDSLWSISQKFQGISVEQIKKINGLKNNEVKIGQVLKLG